MFYDGSAAIIIIVANDDHQISVKMITLSSPLLRRAIVGMIVTSKYQQQ